MYLLRSSFLRSPLLHNPIYLCTTHPILNYFIFTYNCKKNAFYLDEPHGILEQNVSLTSIRRIT